MTSNPHYAWSNKHLAGFYNYVSFIYNLRVRYIMNYQYSHFINVP